MSVNLVGLDTEWFQHYGNLHRPGGKFACLTTSGLGVPTNNFLSADKEESQKYLLAWKEYDGVIALQNAIYDIRQLTHHGIWPMGWEPAVWDTMMVEQDLFGGWYQSFSLQALARRHLRLYLEKDIRNEFVDATELTPDMAQYAIQDADVTRQVALAQWKIVYNEYEAHSHGCRWMDCKRRSSIRRRASDTGRVGLQREIPTTSAGGAQGCGH